MLRLCSRHRQAFQLELSKFAQGLEQLEFVSGECSSSNVTPLRPAVHILRLLMKFSLLLLVTFVGESVRIQSSVTLTSFGTADGLIPHINDQHWFDIVSENFYHCGVLPSIIKQI